jgi:hypothetical protein
MQVISEGMTYAGGSREAIGTAISNAAPTGMFL